MLEIEGIIKGEIIDMTISMMTVFIELFVV
ncbi:hypothetical protein VIBNISFn118_1000017 [Vibrio nigripulchritudo SFn118]|nr:hypothetical protein VIBNISFn118_1000017 [Vibrio nigripulchritudo SFn118]